MSLSVPGGPAAVDIFNIPGAYAGNVTGPNPGNFGIGGPQVPMVPWAPRGSDTNQAGPAAFLNYGRAPTSHGHITLKSWDFIQYQYTVPPWDDDSHLQLARDMLVWTLNEIEPDLDTHHVRSLPQLNQLCSEALEYFRMMVREGDAEALRFRGYLERYGEGMLEQYINAENKNRLEYFFEGTSADADADVRGDLKQFRTMATMDTYCYLTKWGICNKWSFSGSIINVNRATSLEVVDHTREEDHFVEINVGLAKRVRVANVFGDQRDITTGSQTWVALRRKHMADGRSGAFEFVPGGSTMTDRPLLRDTRYFDDSGRQCFGHVWKIGTVIEPGDFDPQISAIEGATNLGAGISARRAYECHAQLPTLYLAMGFKH